MHSLRILSTGRIDERESAFPQAVELPNGDILCSYSVGGGQYVHGGTDWSRSTDGGVTWKLEGQLLPATVEPQSASALKLSLSVDGKTVYAYGTRYWGSPDEKFGERRGETVFCQSTDNGHSWSQPQAVPMPDCPMEISHSIRPLTSGRLLAPGALLAKKDRLGEEVLVAVSDDGGGTWPHHRTVFRDPDGKLGFFEQKFAEIKPGVVMAAAWTVTLGDYHDQCNSFCISHDDGWTWGPHQSTGIRGQTLSFLPLGGDRLLVLYNRRYGKQGVVMALATFTETQWNVIEEDLLYDAQGFRDGPQSGASGVDEFAAFQFGFPTAIRLQDGTFLATNWSVERGLCGIRWTKLAVQDNLTTA
ncbi:MAG: exo-alpha-sialidase [Planctomycetaceae bacterium]|nr:exo-alpha-sialidase [Planctomycetaceae bacterium]